MIAATLRQMAAPEAKVKSEIHMRSLPFCFVPVTGLLNVTANAEGCLWFRKKFAAAAVK
jgi:hypothetical protein